MTSDKFRDYEANPSEASFDVSDQGDAVEEIKGMALRETRGAMRWKFLVLLSMLVTGGLISGGTYKFLKEDEDGDYTQSYWQFANSVKGAVKGHAENVFLAMKSCSNAITSDAKVVNSTFPYQTLEDFETLGNTIRKFSSSEMFGWVPLLEEESQLSEWSQYSVGHQDWIQTSREQILDAQEGSVVTADYRDGSISPWLYQLENGTTPVAAKGPGPYGPLWQTSPPPFDPVTINLDMMSLPFVAETVEAINVTRESLLSEWPRLVEVGALAISAVKPSDHEAYHRSYVSWEGMENGKLAYNNPHLFLFEPVFAELHKTSSKMVGFVVAVLAWDVYMTDLLPDGVEGITVVLRNDCGQNMTYILSGTSAHYAGELDGHDPAYDDTQLVVPFSKYSNPDLVEATPGHCSYSFHIYASSTFEDRYRSGLPLAMAGAVAASFSFLIVAFFMYDWFVRKRYRKVLSSAVRTSELVSSLFPKAVRDRVLTEKREKITAASSPKEQSPEEFRDSLKSFLRDTSRMDVFDQSEDEDHFMYKTKPIADLYPSASILFCDIAGFTSWSSSRDPTSVFILLETIYKAFDGIARRRRVYKVETIGDSYVAVAGCPDVMKNHPVVMARFARECLLEMHKLTRRLVPLLGADTANLDMRFGIHSGPVTAGVLRGERARFQLFGDTMNTASRMESTGQRGKIQISQETADLLIGAGKVEWVTRREETVVAKGKGELQTYWLKTTSGTNTIETEASITETGVEGETNLARGEREEYRVLEALEETTESSILHEQSPAVNMNEGRNSTTMVVHITWTVNVLVDLLKEVRSYQKQPREGDFRSEERSPTAFLSLLDEMQDEISQPVFGEPTVDRKAVVLDDKVVEELHGYVNGLASMHSDNAFNNFEHSCYVTMRLQKLFSDLAADTFHPLVRFAAIFSTVIQAVDHAGIPNFHLAIEKPQMASVYKQKCVIQQNAFHLSWELLMEGDYANLRRAIYQTEEEQRIFRQIMVNCIIATESLDKDHRMIRENRWVCAFGSSNSQVSANKASSSLNDQQATILLEHMVQISTMAHMVQNWESYKIWNRRLYEEMHKAFIDRRILRDPSQRWFEGELGCFDFFVLPLTKRLRNCGRFGPTTDDMIAQAEHNRKQWYDMGRALVHEMSANSQGPTTEKNRPVV